MDKNVLVKIKDLVVGDVIKLKPGDTVPADLILIDSTNLRVDESHIIKENSYEKKTISRFVTNEEDIEVYLPNVARLENP
jgi:Ca2+-transporting ATPase